MGSLLGNPIVAEMILRGVNKVKDLRLIRYLVLFSFIAVGSHLCYSDNNANAGVAFNLELVTVGEGSNWTSEKSGYPESSTKPFRLTATITPLSLASSIAFSSDDATISTVSEVSRTDGSDDQVVVLEVTGLSETPPESPDGEAKIQAKNGTKVVAEVPVVVVVPKTQTHSVGAPILVNGASTADGVTYLVSSSGSMVTIMIQDQFGSTLSSIYNGTYVVEEMFSNREPEELFPGTWSHIIIPDHRLIDGRKFDSVSTSYTITIYATLDQSILDAWEQKTYNFYGSYNAFQRYNVIDTASADMKVRVGGSYELTPDFKRVVSCTDPYADVPVTVTDDDI
ncbi:hypothetical protein P4C99_21650 [Pontiellaceae bacterium B1224]|nr:hypothetical protein [Pontiellaceae bacterium B1224]